jgi:cell fate regulator YaaT (PSP1 superfamily)
MMTITPPRSESSPELSPCKTPKASSANQQQLRVKIDQHHQQQSVVLLDKAPGKHSFSTPAAALDLPHLAGGLKSAPSLPSAADYSLLSGRPLINFQPLAPSGSASKKSGPSPPADIFLQPVAQQQQPTDFAAAPGGVSVGRRHSVSAVLGSGAGAAPSTISYRNALVKNSPAATSPAIDFPVPQTAATSAAPSSASVSTTPPSVNYLQQPQQQQQQQQQQLPQQQQQNETTSSPFGDFGFDAHSWSNALGNLHRAAAASTKPMSISQHRNTMPSLSQSPFAENPASAGALNGSIVAATTTGVNVQQQPSQQQPAVNGNLPYCGTSLNCFLVQFTSGRTDTFYIPQNQHQPQHQEMVMDVQVGDYVVVEADRGEDLGRVIMDNINVPMPRRNSTSASQQQQQHHQQFHGMQGMGMDDCVGAGAEGSSGGNNLPKQIYRLAQPVEVESLLGKVRDELNAIAVGQYKVQEWKLPMAIIDAEYQWDRRKLTFFFSVTLPQYFPNQPSPRIDFRTLVRDLYQIYRTRIWMYCVDKDKQRSNRSHNREKFLKQLQKDTASSASSSVSASLTTSNTATTNLTAHLTNPSTTVPGNNEHQQQQQQKNSGSNSLKAVLVNLNGGDDGEEDSCWAIIDRLNSVAIQDAVEDLSTMTLGGGVNR